MSRTARQLISASMRVLGITASGETPTADEMADGLEALKIMLEQWSFEGLPVEALTEINHTVLAGVGSYTIGPAGCDIISDWPVEIVSGYCSNSQSLDYPIKIISEQEYDEIALKTTAGTPFKLFYNPTYPNGQLKLYYVPESDMAMVLKAVTMMDEPANLSAEITFPPPYDSAIKWNLPIEIAPEFEKTPSNIVVQKAYHSKAIIEARNAMNRTAPVRVSINRSYRNFNINEG
jgi:hypothetical protein